MDSLDVAGLGVDAFKLGYNLFTNQRDFDYQKALQQQIFQREDTAVQRRMADLKAAGINPNLAAGSAAGAGSVVSRSNTNDLGSALDTVQAINSIRQQKQSVKNAEQEEAILKNEKFIAEMNKKISYFQVLQDLGFRPRVILGSDGNITIQGQRKTNKFEDTPLGQMLDIDLRNMRNSASLLEKQSDWYVANQILGAIGSAGNLVIGGTNAYSNYKKAMKWR